MPIGERAFPRVNFGFQGETTDQVFLSGPFVPGEVVRGLWVQARATDVALDEYNIFVSVHTNRPPLTAAGAQSGRVVLVTGTPDSPLLLADPTPAAAPQGSPQWFFIPFHVRASESDRFVLIFFDLQASTSAITANCFLDVVFGG